MSEWRETTLGEIINFKTGKLNSNAAITQGKYPFFTCSPETFTIDEYAFDCEAILLAGNNANGIYPIKKYKGKFNAYQRTYVITIKDESLSDLDYIYYLLGLRLNYLRDISQGSATKFLTAVILNNLYLQLPPLQEQKEIAAVLSCLDAKIENLRRQNETLERIAQTLFKHWFIDFEFPNEKGEPYRSSGGAMQPSELGEIPAGWRVGKLENICKIINGFAFKSEDYREEGIKIIRTKNFNNLESIELNNLVYISETELEKYKKFELHQFDFLMVMVGASIGKFVIVSTHILPALQNQNMWNFRANKTEYQMYLNYSLKILIGKHSRSSTGSAREFFRKDYFYQVPIVLPDRFIMNKFSTFCLKLAHKIDLNIQQIQTLTQTRDTLLPKLMSGKLRVTE